MDIPYTPNVLQTQTHGVLCTVRALQLQPAQGCQGPLVTQQSIGSGSLAKQKHNHHHKANTVQINAQSACCSQLYGCLVVQSDTAE